MTNVHSQFRRTCDAALRTAAGYQCPVALINLLIADRVMRVDCSSRTLES
jgi:hypothetical protein